MARAVIFKLGSDSVLAFRLIHFFLMTILIPFFQWLIFSTFSVLIEDCSILKIKLCLLDGMILDSMAQISFTYLTPLFSRE